LSSALDLKTVPILFQVCRQVKRPARKIGNRGTTGSLSMLGYRERTSRIERLARSLAVVLAGLAAPASAGDQGLPAGGLADRNAGIDAPLGGVVLMAGAATARPGARNEQCATLRGATGTDFYCASSVRAPQFGNQYGVEHLFNNTTGDAWVAGRPGGIGEWIRIDFKEFRLVTAVIVRNGYQKNPDIFSKNGRVRKFRLVFSEGQTQSIAPQDSMDLQRIALDPAVEAHWVRFIIDEVYPGSRYPDVAISKLFVTAGPVRQAPPAAQP
jgi:hypothetical protein